MNEVENWSKVFVNARYWFTKSEYLHWFYYEELVETFEQIINEKLSDKKQK